MNDTVYPVKGEDQPHTSSVLTPLPPRTRIRQCRFCEYCLEQNVLLEHLRTSHGEEGRIEAEKMALVKRRKIQRDVERCGDIAPSEDKWKNRLMKCPLCEESRTQENLVDHCRIVHGDSRCVTHTRTFQNLKQCEEWKDSIARTHCTAWQMDGVVHLVKDLRIAYYHCSRVSNNQYSAQAETKKSEAMTINCCTSYLKEIYLQDRTIIARYCTRHISHDVSAAKLPLSNTDKAVVARYLRPGFDVKFIANKISKVYTDPRTKLHWIATSEIDQVLSSLEANQRKIKEADTSKKEKGSIKMEYQIPGPQLVDGNHETEAISASDLLKAPSDSEDDTNYGVINEVKIEEQFSKSGSLVKSPLGCTSCTILHERVAELEAIAKRLNDRVMKLEEAQIINALVRTEGTSSQEISNVVKQERR